MEILTQLNIEEKATMMDSYIMKFATMTIVHYFIKILWTVFLC
ncbi:ABC transporter ATP-binding protein YvcR (plasmid) [Bacillus cereus]|nr:ABC transporter ATP-binding protein YvcR [Bacillus cereus]